MMDDSAKAEQARRWGLCASCTHSRVVPNDRGDEFVQCGLAKQDPRYRRYPHVPVRACQGFEDRGAAAPV